jgi:topoisomerase-4 subunit B
VSELGAKCEITRFKGLGEISPDEFEKFIGDDIKLTPVILRHDIPIQQLLEYYMGKNTPDRQNFIIENLKIEIDVVKEEPVLAEME